MSNTARFAEIAALAGNPGRAEMLHALLEQRAMTAKELARAAGLAPQTASEHLAKLVNAGLVHVKAQGRHRYHRLASDSVAEMLESIMIVAASDNTARRPIRFGPKDNALREGRTCYKHLAGRLGVRITDALVDAGHIELSNDAGVVTKSGDVLFQRLGVSEFFMRKGRSTSAMRAYCRPCIDWSERRPHLAGSVGTAICNAALKHAWVRRAPNGRAVSLTETGRRIFLRELGVDLHP